VYRLLTPQQVIEKSKSAEAKNEEEAT